MQPTKILLAFGLVVPLACRATADERKQLAFEVIERNAAADDRHQRLARSISASSACRSSKAPSSSRTRSTAAGFKVELGGAGMPTNLWAEYGSGRPKIAIVTEIDALPGGSQTPRRVRAQAAGRRARPATWKATTPTAASRRWRPSRSSRRCSATTFPGTVAISFGPAEEQLASRPVHRARRLFQGCRRGHLSAHPRRARDRLRPAELRRDQLGASPSTARPRMAPVNPWDGKDAVDAVELMDIGFDKLREHLRPTYRAHRTITIGGIQPNIIPDTGADLVVRARCHRCRPRRRPTTSWSRSPRARR